MAFMDKNDVRTTVRRVSNIGTMTSPQWTKDISPIWRFTTHVCSYTYTYMYMYMFALKVNYRLIMT